MSDKPFLYSAINNFSGEFLIQFTIWVLLSYQSDQFEVVFWLHYPKKIIQLIFAEFRQIVIDCFGASFIKPRLMHQIFDLLQARLRNRCYCWELIEERVHHKIQEVVVQSHKGPRFANIIPSFGSYFIHLIVDTAFK